MPSFRTPQTVRLSTEAIARARSFADAVTSTVNYRDSNQTQLQKISDDHFVSKLGEEAVRSIFEERGCNVKGPDYSIYSGKQKSWDADLKVNDLDVAVKTQRRSAANRYGLSWTFQDSPERHDPILDMPEAWVAWLCTRIQAQASNAPFIRCLRSNTLFSTAPCYRISQAEKR